MKKFAFPLNRVLDWRQMQARIEDLKLEGLYSELRTIDAREAALNQERAHSESALKSSRSASGSELAAVDAFRRFTVAELTRLERVRAECAKKIAEQIQVVAAKRRDVRLLERLKEQRLRQWHLDYGREIEAEAGESHLAKWNRETEPAG